MYRAIDDIATEWEAIVRELKVKDAKITTTQSEHQNNTARANDVLGYWLGADEHASWARLIEAMKVREELTTVANEFKYALQNMVPDEP